MVGPVLTRLSYKTLPVATQSRIVCSTQAHFSSIAGAHLHAPPVASGTELATAVAAARAYGVMGRRLRALVDKGVRFHLTCVTKRISHMTRKACPLVGRGTQQSHSCRSLDEPHDMSVLPAASVLDVGVTTALRGAFTLEPELQQLMKPAAVASAPMAVQVG